MGTDDTESTVTQQLQELEEKIEEIRERTKAKIVENHTDIESLQEQVEELRDQVETLSVRTGDHPDALSRVDYPDPPIETDTESNTPQTEDSDIQDEIAELEKTLEDHSEKLNILAHHITELNKLKTQVETLNEKLTQQQVLSDIKFKLIKHNVSKITCESCTEQLSFDELDSLYCPNCSKQFTDLTVTSRFFKSNVGTLQTAD